ncbi:hypothetical protein OUZ56_021611 [Daphnia magna]|uniref:Uncharacterized protein n=1 Tax=Daphnia magna TaxID=35525 RepID=A0ABR0ATZ9_9CRUS|nr:hypothetical protein OUZ56_021611 [Daphnia magna]
MHLYTTRLKEGCIRDDLLAGAATVDQAGPANDNVEVELDGEALLYCEALLASEASPLGIGDSAGEPEQLSDGQDSNLEQPAILLPAILLPAVETPAIMPPSVVPPMASKQAEQAMALLGQGFWLLGPVLSHLVASEKAGLPGPSSPIYNNNANLATKRIQIPITCGYSRHGERVVEYTSQKNRTQAKKRVVGE